MLIALVGVLIGLVLGLTGAGGSVIAVPLLIFLLHVSPAEATGLALGVVAVSSIVGAIQRIVQREVLWVPVLLFATSGVVLAPVGRWLAADVPEVFLLTGFALLSWLIAARMLWQSIAQPELAQLVRAGGEVGGGDALLCRFSAHGYFDWRVRCVAGLVVGGLLTGLLSGLFGVGGGFLIVPFLNQLNGVSMRYAIATSLVIIAMIAGSGFVAHLTMQTIDGRLLLWLGSGGVVGMLLGSVLAKRIAGAYLQGFFALVIAMMAVMILLRAH